MDLRRIAAVVLLGFSVTGCATVIRGTNTKFEVTSTPPGASVRTNNGFACDATPCHFRMSRKDGFDVTVSLAGYQTQKIHVKSKASADGVAEMTGGNFLIGGVIGSAVDVADGATNNLSPNPLAVVLVKSGDAAAAQGSNQASAPTTS